MHSFLRLLSLSMQWKNAALDFARMDCASADKYVVDHADKICGAEPDLLIASNIAEAGKRLASHPHYRQRGIQILEMLICSSSPPQIALIGFAAYSDAIKNSPLKNNPFDTGQKRTDLKFLLGRFDNRFPAKALSSFSAGRVRVKIIQHMREMGMEIPPRISGPNRQYRFFHPAGLTPFTPSPRG